MSLQVVSGPHFLATKLEAFNDRGRADFYASHDLEDVISVIDGRPGLVGEVSVCGEALRAYISGKLSRLQANSAFMMALPGHVLDEGRDEIVLERLRAMAEFATV